MSTSTDRNWYCLELGDGIMADQPLGEIKESFQSIFVSAGCPADMAVFTRHESEGRLHCEVIAYFSPAAKDLAKSFVARSCFAPERSGLGLAAGSDDAWTILFPEKK
jgi:hypothetical protein